MIIPPESLEAETLIAILENYITREGTDYGEHELDLSTKTNMLKRQVIAGEVLIIFDSLSESLNLMTREEHKLWQAQING